MVPSKLSLKAIGNCLRLNGEVEFYGREESCELRMKASTKPSPKGKSAFQEIDVIIDEPFSSYEIAKERHHEISSHFRWHQEHEHPRRAGRPTRQTDCRVQRPLHSHCHIPLLRWA